VEYRVTIPSTVSFRFDLQTNRGTGGGGISEIDLTINSAAFTTLTTDPSDITVENTASSEVGSKVGSNWQIGDSTAVIKNSAGTTIHTESIPAEVSENITIADTTATAKNSANTTIGTAAQVAGVNTTVTVADITVTDSDGSTSSVPAGVNVTCTPQVYSIKAVFPLGLNFTDTFTIDSDSAATYTSTTNDGSSGTITISINAGAYAAFVNPTTLAVNDTIKFQRTTTTAAGWVKLNT